MWLVSTRPRVSTGLPSVMKTTARVRPANTLPWNRAIWAAVPSSPSPSPVSTKRTSRSRVCSHSPSLTPPITIRSNRTRRSQSWV
uniref:Uncharacterized protein n=1 Tax=Anopheles maculatus TaxID=74869 RepID=A0A182T0S3_9DIPT